MMRAPRAMSADMLLRELIESARLMTNQEEKGDDTQAIAASQHTQFLAKVASLPALSASNAGALSDAYDAAPFSAEQQVEFASRVAARLAGGETPEPTPYKGQEIHIENYMPGGLWTNIGNVDVDLELKIQEFGNLYVALEAFQASEPSLAR